MLLVVLFKLHKSFTELSVVVNDCIDTTVQIQFDKFTSFEGVSRGSHGFPGISEKLSRGLLGLREASKELAALFKIFYVINSFQGKRRRILNDSSKDFQKFLASS